MQIICIGDLCCDLIVPYGRMRDALARGDISRKMTDTLQVTMQPGGSVGNVARHLGQLKARPVFVTPLKRDRLGEYLAAEMEKRGVDMRWAASAARSNMYCVAVLDQSGERTMFCYVPPWADYPRFEDESFASVPQFPEQILFTSGMAFLEDAANNEAILSFLKERKKTGARIVFDLNVRAESYGYEGERKRAMEEMIALSDILLGSGEDEFCQVTGTGRIREAAGLLCGRGVGVTIARDGGNPILIRTAGTERIIPVKPVKPVSTLGAGDCFDAMFLWRVSLGDDIAQAVRKASDYAGDYIQGRAVIGS